jgi:hypothetical protein
MILETGHEEMIVRFLSLLFSLSTYFSRISYLPFMYSMMLNLITSASVSRLPHLIVQSVSSMWTLRRVLRTLLPLSQATKAPSGASAGLLPAMALF